MTNAILNLQKRHNRVLALRTNYLHTTDKEDTTLLSLTLAKFDSINQRILNALRKEYSKAYMKPKEVINTKNITFYDRFGNKNSGTQNG